MRKAAEVISALFKDRFGPEFVEKAQQNAGLFSSWPQIVKEVWPNTADPDQNADDIPAAAAHSKIRELERGLLTVEADHPGWVQILQIKQGELLSAVKRKYPELDIRSISFRLSGSTVTGVQEIPEPKQQTLQSRIVDSQPQIVPEVHEQNKIPKKPSDDNEFYTALKNLQASVKKRNSL